MNEEFFWLMSITRTQAFIAKISNLQPGEGLGLGEGQGACAFTCLNVHDNDLGSCN